ncbi:hypothetical protein [Ligilactobacillus murinus]|jgi:hypothetical protein|uniref:Uncharacterized protein n=1 Tax=Ligilactobacillus murinus TaxID=1622 RepID=A0A4V6RE48_9LACO|nr:hypothetical protein [Ligilactobacillus murinus]HAB49965.1 hypothetical protein [Lactobacillus sp.]MCR1879935.1 hypothetical protein [Ligilactobacillus murinus]NBH41975.1 hypothetical protein [Ligilactobacillus murinus]NEF81844.1 hypothetical protein [Ligilactobacillus murinus]NEF83971.1 hypothetical protein [Ligilactobacillus murinus]
MKKTKQPFYRNKVAMILRTFSLGNVIMAFATFLRGVYLYMSLGWMLGAYSTLYIIFVPFIIATTEVLHTKAVEYGSKLFEQKQ